jgi:streptogramin lyase
MEMLQQRNEMYTVLGRAIERLFPKRQLRSLAAAAFFVGLAVLGAAFPAHAEDLGSSVSTFGEVVLEAAPKNVYMESDTRLWYTLPSVDKLALVDNGTATYYPVDADAINNSQPYDLVVQDGAVWFTMLAANKIGKLDIASGNVTTYPIPTADSHPTGITFGGGYIWFVERTGDKLGQLDRASGTITEYYDWVYDFNSDKNLVDMKGAQLEDVAYIAGNVWFTGPALRLGGADLYNPSTGKWVASPNNNLSNPVDTLPMQIAGDSLGNVWVTFSGLNYIGRSALNTLAVWDPFRLPAGTGGPVGLFIHEANNVRELWYTRPEGNSVGRVATRYSGVKINTQETPLPTANSAPWGIAVTGAGSAWTATSNAAKTVTWNAPYYSFFLRLPQLLCNSGSCTQ